MDTKKYGNLLGIIGDRHTETGKYIAAGDELNELEEAKNTNLELLELANYAHVIKAARQTGLIVGSMIRAASRKNNGKQKWSGPSRHGLSISSLAALVTPKIDKKQYTIGHRKDDRYVWLSETVFAGLDCEVAVSND